MYVIFNTMSNMSKKAPPKKSKNKKYNFPESIVCTRPQPAHCKTCGDKKGGCGQCGGDKLACTECPACFKRFRINPKQKEVNQKLDSLGELREKLLGSKEAKAFKSLCEKLGRQVLNGKEVGVNADWSDAVSKNADQASVNIVFNISSEE